MVAPPDSYLLQDLEKDPRVHTLSDEQRQSLLAIRRQKEITKRELDVLNQEISKIDQDLAQYDSKHTQERPDNKAKLESQPRK